MSDEGCVFCKIVRGETEAEVVFDGDEVLAFRDIDGRAPVHVLVIPKEHVSSLAEIGEVSDGVAKRLFEAAYQVAESEGISETGYAFRINNGRDAGQEVFHLHAHVMGGERVRMP